MAAFITSFIYVVLAEMGDKTQLLTMAFASRYSTGKVLLAVFLATVVNHALAVSAGRLLTVIVPAEIISLIAACSFIVFGLWSIHGDTLKAEDEKKSRFGPVVTIAAAFFIAEMGDRTQFATASLAVQYRNMAYVLMGTTLGMVTANAIGIVVGKVMRKHIPEKGVKWIFAVVSVLIGLVSIYKLLSTRLNAAYVWGIILLASACAIYLSYYLARPKRLNA